ncbi:MAG: ATP-dependent Clp protease proteolytic subunit [Myxococcales bacterium]|nr:ATP-dependent Clp protease proteolytic subunit [Myxococcales bacterium]MCB9733409.1 ATP-dependent Clp protease proteolytic subunit [Deltaproteobacteria bacterium]
MQRLRSLAHAVLLPSLLAASVACGTTEAHAAAPGGQKKAPTGETVVLTDRVVELTDGIALGNVKKAQKQMLELDGQSHEPIWVLINSPGGSVDAGLILIDTMKAVQSPIHCVVESKAYSMAAIILTYCDRRYGFPHSTFMLHEASYGTVGEDPSNRSKLDFLTRYLDMVHEEIARNLGMELKTYRARIRDAWWLLADEAKKINLIDTIITSMTFEELPVEKTEAKKTVTYTTDVDAVPDAPKIPKRRD